MKWIFKYILVLAMLFICKIVSAQSTIKVLAIENGTVTIDKNSAFKGETVIITVTPDNGYYSQKEDLKVVKAVNPSTTGTRGEIPIADEIALSGIAPDDLSTECNYVFTIPDDGYVFCVTAAFSARTAITDDMVEIFPATNFLYNGLNQKPTVSVNGLTEGTDYSVSFAESTWKEPGSYSVSVSGISRYMGTVNKTFTISAFDSNICVGGFCYNINTITKNAEVESCMNGCSGDVVIPESFTYESKSYSVTSIANSAFANCSGLTSVAIPASITSIGQDAFADCNNLTRIYISDLKAWCNISFGFGSFPRIGHHLFLNGEEIKELIIPSGVTSIPARAFAYCEYLTSVNICDGVTLIDMAAFYACSSLTLVTIPDGVTMISMQAFHDCSSINSVNVASSTPPFVLASSFPNRSSATLFVPIGSVDAYKAANYWKNFGQITDLTPPSAKSGLFYTGAAQDLITACSSTTGTFTYSLNGTSWSEFVPQGIDAKEYTVYYEWSGYHDGYHHLIGPKSFKVTIAPKTVNSPTITLSATSLVYDGFGKEPVVTVKDGEMVIPSSEYMVNYSNNTTVGTAIVTITDKAGGNYNVSGSTTFTISAADGSLTHPSAKSNLVYTGAAQDLITAGSSTTGTMQYSLDGTNYSTEIHRDSSGYGRQGVYCIL